MKCEVGIECIILQESWGRTRGEGRVTVVKHDDGLQDGNFGPVTNSQGPSSGGGGELERTGQDDLLW